MSKSSTKGTKYYGWENVPVGVLVKAKAEGEGRFEFYVKLTESGTGQAHTGIEGAFVDFYYFDPDDYTNGVYKAMH